MSEQLLQQIDALFTRRIGVFAEDIQHKLDLLVEGQQGLSERLDATRDELKADIAKVDHRLTVVEARLDQRIDGLEARLDQRIDKLDAKLDAVAADLTAHRRDTEAHGGYRVGE